MIEVLEPGLWTSVQDLGRPGLARYGIPRGGAVDRFAAQAANRLVGNSPNAALLECTHDAPTLRFARNATVAVTGGDCAGIPGWLPRDFPAGTTVSLGQIRPGLRTYLGVRGGIAVPKVMGSRSLCQAGAFGGSFGRPLRAGDRLPIGRTASRPIAERPWPATHRLPLQGPWEVRVLAGPHDHAFPTGTMRRFLDTAFRVSPQADRTGIRLTAPTFRPRGSEILTTAVPEGGIQVTPSGELIALLADHPTTGGYPMITTVISADLPLLAQARPGDTIHFRLVSLAEARRARRRLDAWLGV